MAQETSANISDTKNAMLCEPEAMNCHGARHPSGIDRKGHPVRIGFTTANEFSDHVMEKKNYLYLAPSKLRGCAIGPELLIDDFFDQYQDLFSWNRPQGRCIGFAKYKGKENIDALYSYVRRIGNDPRVERVDSLVSADPHFTLEQYELLYTHPLLIADPYLGALLQSTVSGDTALVEVISKYQLLDMDSKTLVQTIRNTDPGHGIKILVDGGTAGNIDYVTSLYSDFPTAVLIVAITTYIVLLFLFRSLVLPLKALIMNTLSILASYGALVIIFQNGFLHQLLSFSPLGFVEASSPILLFCSLFGLSMDYEVFLLSRVQEAFWQTGDNRRAVALGLQRSGGIITSAAVIVIVVCICFATADTIIVKALGIGMALAVIIDATLVRGLLVPATMRLLGNWNWWLPFGGVQRHPPTLAEYMQIGNVSTHSTAEANDEKLQLEGRN